MIFKLHKCNFPPLHLTTARSDFIKVSRFFLKSFHFYFNTWRGLDCQLINHPISLKLQNDLIQVCLVMHYHWAKKKIQTFEHWTTALALIVLLSFVLSGSMCKTIVYQPTFTCLWCWQYLHPREIFNIMRESYLCAYNFSDISKCMMI